VRLSRKLIAIPVVGAGLLGVGIAFAAWTSSGSGSGTAQATDSQNSVIAAGTSAADLYPGATKSVTVTISNPNAYPVLVNTSCVAGTVTSDVRATDATGLFQSDNSTKTIAAGGSGTYTLVTHMAASAVDACKSQTFALSLSATLSSNA